MDIGFFYFHVRNCYHSHLCRFVCDSVSCRSSACLSFVDSVRLCHDRYAHQTTLQIHVRMCHLQIPVRMRCRSWYRPPFRALEFVYAVPCLPVPGQLEASSQQQQDSVGLFRAREFSGQHTQIQERKTGQQKAKNASYERDNDLFGSGNSLLKK